MRSFLLLYYPGTGSSWLAGMLAAAPGVWLPGYEPLERWHWDAPEPAKLAWLAAALAGPPTGDPADPAWLEALHRSPQCQTDPPPAVEVIGLKMTEDAIQDRAALLDVLDGAATDVLFVVRENRIKQALSLYRSYEERKNQFQFAGVMPPTTVDFATFDRWLDVAVGWHDRTVALREACRARLGAERVATVAYEAFAADAGKAAVLEEACGFLGLDGAPVLAALDEMLGGGDPFGPQGHYRKATADDLAAAVVNYDRLRRRYRGTPFERDFSA